MRQNQAFWAFHPYRRPAYVNTVIIFAKTIVDFKRKIQYNYNETMLYCQGKES